MTTADRRRPARRAGGAPARPKLVTLFLTDRDRRIALNCTTAASSLMHDCVGWASTAGASRTPTRRTHELRMRDRDLAGTLRSSHATAGWLDEPARRPPRIKPASLATTCAAVSSRTETKSLYRQQVLARLSVVTTAARRHRHLDDTEATDPRYSARRIEVRAANDLGAQAAAGVEIPRESR